MFKFAFRSKNVKVQPTSGLDLKTPNGEFEFVESRENGLKLQTSLHSIEEESLKGTYGGSSSSMEDALDQNSPSIERIRKEVKSLRVLVAALVVVSIISFALNIWTIDRQRVQNEHASLKAMEKGTCVTFNLN